MRKLPEGKDGLPLAPPTIEPQLDLNQVRSYELITPLFGGGVESGTADPVTVIRGTGIRGQLRFWWRACRGGGFNGSLEAMKEAEGLLWGAASTEKKPRPSKVEIVVSTDCRGEDKYPFKVVPGKPDQKTGKPKPKLQSDEQVAPAYAAFPLQPSDSEMRTAGVGMRTKAVRSGVRFTLRISYPKNEKEGVEAALWAWETFGGVGARTRRGFGALKLISVDGKLVQVPGADSAEAKIREGLQAHVVSGTWPGGVPHLGRNLHMKVTGMSSSAKGAWEHLIQRLKQFRQERNSGATPRRPGRSQWPEPDEIRRLTARRCARHATPLSTVEKFPRAAFGLPIGFHFKDKNAGDPEDTILQGKDYERFASPLILRPLAYADGQAVGLALILEGTDVTQLPGGLILKGAPGEPAVQAALTSEEARSIPPLDGDQDVLRAFLNKL